MRTFKDILTLTQLMVKKYIYHIGIYKIKRQYMEKRDSVHLHIFEMKKLELLYSVKRQNHYSGL